MKRFRKKHSGFTLIEAAIVLFIVSLLMLIILPNLNAQRKHAVTTHAAAMVTTVQTQIDLYQNDHPNQDNVTLAALKSENYLTEKQFQKAQDLKITIVHNEARK